MKLLLALIKGDIRFQWKYGFYLVYLIFSILYIGLLYAFPESWRKTAGVLLIFTDPAAMGLFFMGAIVLYEKSEHVLDSIAVSIIKPLDYTLSKLLSLSLISLITALVIGLSTGIIQGAGIIYYILGVFLGSCLTSAVGLAVAANAPTLNSFIIRTIIPEIVLSVPAVYYLFSEGPAFLIVHPGAAVIDMLINSNKAWISLLSLIIWTIGAVWIAVKKVEKAFVELGGVKL
jgi:fluoroquinolone transport system permease protein